LPAELSAPSKSSKEKPQILSSVAFLFNITELHLVILLHNIFFPLPPKSPEEKTIKIFFHTKNGRDYQNT